MKTITISEIVKPLIQYYIMARMKYENIKNKLPKNVPHSEGEEMQLSELHKLMEQSAESILQILFDENKENIESIIKPKNKFANSKH